MKDGHARRDALADRLLLLLGVVAVTALGLIAWFAAVRPGTSTLVRAGLAGLALVALAVVALRHRLYGRLGPTRLLALALGAALPLGLVEVVANSMNPEGYLYFAECQRYFYWQRHEGILQDHAHPPDATLSFPWGTITTNAEGWRSPPVAPAPAPATLRVLALGDSFCFSWGVDDAHTVCVEVQRALAARADLAPYRAVEVVNTGNGSYSGIDELLVLRDRGLALGPGAAFLLVCSNDFTDRPVWTDQVEALRRLGVEEPATLTAFAATARERPGLLAPRGEPARTLFGLVSQALNRSFTVVLASKLLRGRAPGAAHPVTGVVAGANHALPADPSAVPSDALPAVPNLSANYPFLAEGTAAVREIAATCRARAIPLAVLVLAPGADELALTDHLRDALLRPGAGPLAPVVALRWPEDAARLANSKNDGHWNAEGTRLFGAKIAETLADVMAGRRPPAAR